MLQCQASWRGWSVVDGSKWNNSGYALDHGWTGRASLAVDRRLVGVAVEDEPTTARGGQGASNGVRGPRPGFCLPACVPVSVSRMWM